MVLSAKVQSDKMEQLAHRIHRTFGTFGHRRVLQALTGSYRRTLDHFWRLTSAGC